MTRLSPVGILTAYREGGITFDEAVTAIDLWAQRGVTLAATEPCVRWNNGSGPEPYSLRAKKIPRRIPRSVRGATETTPVAAEPQSGTSEATVAENATVESGL
jgi:hypothetical protein